MNRLAQETSPYLRQHQDNPVDWYPWGDAAFERARREDRPILLSVGYSSCHWCHVMAHESFEDPRVAELQNRLFVSVKVDREERPDVDRVYMDALQALTGSGGWPMTVFLLPDGRPYYAGTYFPPEDRPGLPGFRKVLEALARAYHERRSEVVANAERLSQALRPPPLLALPPDPANLARVLAGAEARLLSQADPERGGLGDAPKFPQCAVLEFLLGRAVLVGSAGAQEVVRRALQGMAQGGIHDQLGGGFHRYSVDRQWAVPHFEKMLYDNAQLVRLYLHAHLVLGDPDDLAVARRTADFLLSELGLEGGGLAASLDADTEAGEGAFYSWDRSELEAALGQGGARRALELFSVASPARTAEGRLVLGGGSGGPERAELVRRLLEVRGRRPRPHRDDKLIVGWNALAISALAELALAVGEERYLERALAAARAILERASVDGEVRHLFDGHGARFTATLEDLAALGLAALALHEATGEASWFELSLGLLQRIEADYRDPVGAGWFDSPDHHDPHLGARPRTLEDGAQPSGVSLATELCLRLQALTGERSFGTRAEAVLAAMSSAAERFPSGFGALLSAMSLSAAGAVELALVAPDAHLSHWPLLSSARRRLRPQLVVGVGRVSAGDEEAKAGPPLARSRPLLEGLPSAYVCRRFACRLPVTSEDALERELELSGTGQRSAEPVPGGSA